MVTHHLFTVTDPRYESSSTPECEDSFLAPASPSLTPSPRPPSSACSGATWTDNSINSASRSLIWDQISPQASTQQFFTMFQHITISSNIKFKKKNPARPENLLRFIILLHREDVPGWRLDESGFLGVGSVVDAAHVTVLGRRTSATFSIVSSS